MVNGHHLTSPVKLHLLPILSYIQKATAVLTFYLFKNFMLYATANTYTQNKHIISCIARKQTKRKLIKKIKKFKIFVKFKN